MRLKQIIWFVLVSGMVVWASHGVHAAVFINEVLADPAAGTGDANGDGIVSSLQDEFIELVNTGPFAVSLGGWRLSDSVQARHVFAAGDAIPGYGFTVVFGSTASSGGLSLNNGGDSVSLYDETLALIDQMVYGAEGGQDTSLTRSPDGSGGFTAHMALNSAAFSPGLTLDGEQFLPHEEAATAPPSSLSDETQGAPTVPEPASWLLLTLGMTQFPYIRRRSIMGAHDEKIPADHRRAPAPHHLGDRDLYRHV